VKAAVLPEVGGVPRYEEFPDPVAGPDEVLVEVKAVAVENVDKLVAAGRHYASGQYTARLPAIPGFDGVGTLPDGTLIGFGPPRAPLRRARRADGGGGWPGGPIPAGLDPVTAVVLATAVTGMTIKTAAGFVPGETVLIQGATGVAGRLAVKVARLLGAGRIVATGRDDGALRAVRALGADLVISTAVPDDALAQAGGGAVTASRPGS
jgi:NADPH2:quinone reductase